MGPVDAYIRDSERWPDEIAALRPHLLGCGLEEEIKWRKPCYRHGGANIVIVQEMKEHLSLMFFKGVFIDDVHGALHDQGPNSRSARRMQFTSVVEVEQMATVIREYVARAIEVEEAGLEIGPAPEPELVDELQRRLDQDPELKEAFAALTPGRRRQYNMHISGAKQAKTREARVEKAVPKILAGRGLQDR